MSDQVINLPAITGPTGAKLYAVEGGADKHAEIGVHLCELVGGFVPVARIPAIAISTVTTVADETAMLALTAQTGDVAMRIDINKAYINNGGTSGTVADWTLWLQSLPTKADIGLGNVDNTSDLDKPVSTAQGLAIAERIPDTDKGAANGVGTLTAEARQPASEIPRSAIITNATTTRTLADTDHGATIVFTSTSASTCTVPSTLVAGFFCTIVQGAAGQVTVAAGAGVTLKSRGSLNKTNAIDAVVGITKETTTIARVYGDRA